MTHYMISVRFLEDPSLELELFAVQLDKFTTFSQEISKRCIIWHHLGQDCQITAPNSSAAVT